MRDEGPSPEDLRHFGGDDDFDSSGSIAWCPQCGEEVYYDVNRCPSCERYITPIAERPLALKSRRRNHQAIVIVIIVGLLIATVGTMWGWRWWIP